MRGMNRSPRATDAPHSQFDVVTLGEGLLRFTPPNLRRIEQTSSLDIEVGGSEGNVAVGLARLGLRTAWLSRLTDNPLGRLIAQKLAGAGVDTSHVIWTSEDRVGVYYLEEGRAPRVSQVIYDRQGSAMSRMRPEHLPAVLFAPGAARWLHVSGITIGIGEEARRSALRAIDLAKAAGWGVSFDFNYRSKLWSASDAGRHCDPVCAAADMVIISRNDALAIHGVMSADEEPAVRAVAARFPGRTVVLTLSQDGAAGVTPDGQYARQPAFPVADPVGRIGGGDAFAAGFLFGHLTGPSDDALLRLRLALRWGTAVAALKYATPGDLPLIDRAEVERLVQEHPATPGLVR